MAQRFLTLLKIFVTFVLTFVLMKPIFMLFNRSFSEGATIGDVPGVIFHGLSLDLSTAGYLMILPWLCLAASVWVEWGKKMRIAYLIYVGFLSFLLSVILIGDTCLYSFWQFKLDATIFNYIDSPKGATESVSALYLILVVVSILVLAAAIFFVLRASWPKHWIKCAKRPLTTGLFVLAGGLLFLCIRGGIGRSTANIGMVYYSSNQFLNHSAVNPAFSLISSAQKTQDFTHECDYFKENERQALFAQLKADTASNDAPSYLTTTRPNVVIILMEGFGGQFVEPLGGKAGVTPQFNRLSREGIFFTRCYANSFRTDRGTVSTFSGYPSFPTVSVMKVPEKSRSLPSIAQSLLRVGYTTEFLYGGDINFTGTNGYLMSTGYQKTYGDTDFPVSQRRTHAWGVTDRITFDRLFEMITHHSQAKPYHIGFLTLASHEPWKVPYNRISGDEKANAMAYTDDCLGRFIDRLKKTPQWKNLLIVCLPDHGIVYPQSITEADIQKYHIPMLWLGGAVKKPMSVNTICNQNDMAATLLGQLRLPHQKFRFSRDVLSPRYRYPFAVHTWSGGFTFIDSTGCTVFDLDSKRVLTDSPKPSAARLKFGKAFLQTIYDDLGAK